MNPYPKISKFYRAASRKPRLLYQYCFVLVMVVIVVVHILESIREYLSKRIQVEIVPRHFTQMDEEEGGEKG